jgi:hypothetical protein
MSEKEINRISDLTRGDIVRHKFTGESYIIEDNIDKDTALAVRTMLITNPDEWILILK